MNTKHVALKVGNMKKEQSFILYPYSGGDTIYLQSDKRWITVNLRTGKGHINDKNKNYPRSTDLIFNAIEIELPETIKTELQGHLWHNKGKDGNISGVVFFENKELFSK
jgi:hypothetical protein